jgi:hypothetical protein
MTREETEAMGELTELQAESREASALLIRSCALRAKRVLVCTVRATVVLDSRKPTPYELSGDVVGRPIEGSADEQPDGFYLLGASFKTWVQWCDVRRAWVRDRAPNPCPECGGRDA